MRSVACLVASLSALALSGIACRAGGSIQLGAPTVGVQAQPAQPAQQAQPAQPAAQPTGPAPAGVQDIKDDEGNVYHVQQGEPGDPAVVGCADGQREAFVDAAKYPNIAGCLGSWAGTMSMRTPPTGQACGDDKGPCAAPADLCGTGWHICGASGAVADLKQVTGEECANAGGGRFSAAISHCASQDTDCKYDLSPNANYQCYPTGWCSESVCCGNDCGDFGACTGGVWKDDTHIAQGTDQGCGAVSARRAGGVLCCK